MFRVEIDVQIRNRFGGNLRTRNHVVTIEARDEADALAKALSSFDINFPYSGINKVTYTRQAVTRLPR